MVAYPVTMTMTPRAMKDIVYLDSFLSATNLARVARVPFHKPRISYLLLITEMNLVT